MPETNTAADWPGGVIARYLTVGGGAVDIWYEKGAIKAECGGERCRWTTRMWTEVAYFDTDEVRDQKIDDALPLPQRQAQAHAEKCRALPMPN